MKSAIAKFSAVLDDIKEQGLYKSERIITTPQRDIIDTTAKSGVINMCANNYLGLADNPRIIKAAKDAYDKWGYGMASVRFICGTQQVHKDLEAAISNFLGMEDTILYSSCFDANGGVFEYSSAKTTPLSATNSTTPVLLTVSAFARHKNSATKTIIWKICAKNLLRPKTAPVKIIVTDGVFSMDSGYIANLKGICDLADEFDGLVMVDDSHAVGFMGDKGRGTPEFCGVMGRVDIITGTLGKALGGASGGCVSSKKK